MKNNKQVLSYLLLFLLLSVNHQILFSQCSPSHGETCNEAEIACSLSELNGLACTNLSNTPGHCVPMCSQGGTTDNTSWWGFITGGGAISITLNVGTCTNSQGLEFGIMNDCNCGYNVSCQSLPCVTPGTSKTLNGNVNGCFVYYLWIDGCNGDVCDFTINTTGGGPPDIPPIGFINNVSSGIIEPVCQGVCNFKLFINPNNEYCYEFIRYEWTIDGAVVANTIERQIFVDFPTEGDFEVCVTAYIPNPKNPNLNCAEEGPQCAIVKVRPLPSRIGLPRNICWEAANPAGFRWHNQYIYNSGRYTTRITQANCCKFDSIVDFTVLDLPFAPPVYYITCDNQPYTDITGKKHKPCLYGREIPLPKKTVTFKCDSAILLTAINVEFAANWNTSCIGGMVQLMPDIKILNPCNAGETYEFSYKWYKSTEPNKVLSREERLWVPSVSADYCIEVTLVTAIETETSICVKTFCESFNETDLSDCSFTLSGSEPFCFDPFGSYRINHNAQKVNFYNWSIDGVTIKSNPDSAVIEVEWDLPSKDSGTVCARYETDCGLSCEKCITIHYATKIAGDDFEKRGLSAYLDAKPHPNGRWRLISGPYNVRIEDPTNPKTKITAYNYGYYCFEWSIDNPNCIIKDTLCINLHSFKKASPEYPKHLFDERSDSKSEEKPSGEIFFTPNLIEKTGNSYITFAGINPGEIDYKWFDVYGRQVYQSEMYLEEGSQKMIINAPDHEGIYFLFIEINDYSVVKKVCVY